MKRETPAQGRGSGDSLAGGVKQNFTSEPSVHVVGHATQIQGRERSRWIVVYRCGAGHTHLATVREPSASLNRTAACGRRCVVHLAVEAVAA